MQKEKRMTRKQFEIMEILAASNSILTICDLAKITNYSLEVVKNTISVLTELGYVGNGAITNIGINALESYRVKRAIFIAAGFGSRLAPITFNTPKPLVRVHGKRIIDSLLDACLEIGINDIYIVRGYLAEQFDQLLYKYPMIKFLENPMYNEANNISSSMIARNMLSNSYVFEADLLLSNPKIIKKYHYTSNFLAIKKDYTNDWCFTVKDGIIMEEKVGGLDCWEMVGISYWNKVDGYRLAVDISDIYNSPGGKERYWEQVPLTYCKDHYAVEIRECFEGDVVEIDTFNELKAIDNRYNI